MKKKYQEHKVSGEVLMKEAIERKYGCRASLEEGWMVGEKHCYTFSLEGDRSRLVYAWLKEGPHPSFPTVEISTEPLK